MTFTRREWTQIYLAVGLCLLTQASSGCMDLTVRTREGTIKCVQCSECNAGYEPYPPCHTSEIFNEIGLQKMCVPCRHGFFKQVHDGKPNTLMCKSCSTVQCRDNFIMLHNCTRNSPAVCADICKIGFAKDPFGNCIQKSGTSGTDFTPTLMPTKKSTTGRASKSSLRTTTPSMGTTTKTTETIKKSLKTIHWVLIGVAIALFAVVGVILWRCKILQRTQRGTRKYSKHAGVDPDPEIPMTVPGENICCVCRTPAGVLLCDVKDVLLKMGNLGKSLRDEKDVCNAVFNELSGCAAENNRIENTCDLYHKIYAQLEGVTVSKFFNAFVKIKMRGIPEKVHDDFHPEEDHVFDS